MSYRALTDVLLGQSPAAHPGDTLPDTYLDTAGHPVPVDFERLVEIGSAEKIEDEQDLEQLTRAELDQHAAAQGVEEPEKLPNKQAVIDAVKDTP